MKLAEIQNRIKRTAVLLYGGTAEYKAYVCSSKTLHGTGDHEDGAEIAEDKKIDCFTVYFSDLRDENAICAGGGEYEKIEDATAAVEKYEGFLKWEKTFMEN